MYQRLIATACVLLLPRHKAGAYILLFMKDLQQMPEFCYSLHSQHMPVLFIRLLAGACTLLLSRDWMERLLKKKIDINRKFDFPLLTDVFGTKAICKDSLQDPDYWQSYPDYQTTPLIFALYCQDFVFTHNLLQWGANPNLPDSKVLTPLMHAVKLVSDTTVSHTHTHTHMLT